MKRILEHYARGTFTALEVKAKFMEFVDPTNVDTLVKMLPADILCIIRKSIDEAPCTEEEWNEIESVEISGAHPGRSKPPSKTELEQSKDNYRRKIEMVRSFFEKDKRK